jgi:hypothetical protein
MTEVIEGTAVEVVPMERAVVVAQPGQALVAEVADPSAMVDVAARLATVLKSIVDKQKLYADIKGKRYPTVEAWMTIARLDNVVAREPVPPIRHEDGSYEAFAELLRLSDGMVIGSSSALCGTKDDAPWGGRAEPARRSMAQTRATSRAFRQQYSWIMALAGYEPTPAEEMPRDEERSTEAPVPRPAEQRPELTRPVDGLEGTVALGVVPVDLQYRTETNPGPTFGFKLMVGSKGKQAIAIGPLATAINLAGLAEGDTVQVWGTVEKVPWEKGGREMPPYDRIILERVATADWIIPADSDA